MPTNPAIRFGFGLCLLGLVLALSGLLPGVTAKGSFNWMVLVGSGVYLPGAFLAFFSAKRKERNQILNWLRVIRLGFFVIIVVWFTTMAAGNR